ncbi:hypothetical protein ACFW1A_09590 [Kitasatospora sp. NPDC058965]|uniref:hypothetical protein n=1 Tax=Kitasatospora sp. NPDC058965 TaxID=3346682 RepID=UPI00368CE3E4
MDDSTTGDPLPAEVVTLLQALLREDTPVHRGLLAQLPRLRVTGHCPCPCPTLDFGVADTAAVPPVAGARGPITEAAVLDRDGQPVGGVLVWATGGYLSGLELYSWADEPITRFPGPDRLAW